MRIKPPGFLAATAAAVALALSWQLAAFQWVTPTAINNRQSDIEWRLNPAGCPQSALPMFTRATDVLNFYILADFELRYAGDTAAREAVDGSYVVQCENILDYMNRGYSFRSGGVSLLSQSHGLLTDVDIIFNVDLLSFEVALHEFTHLLGLGHSEVATSIVCQSEDFSFCRSASRLDADDLVGLARLYNMPANCTPYLNDEGQLYFPALDGYWAVLAPVDPEQPTQGWFPLDFGEAEDEDWRCTLTHTANLQRVETEIYYQGNLLDAVFERDGGRWFMELRDQRCVATRRTDCLSREDLRAITG